MGSAITKAKFKKKKKQSGVNLLPRTRPKLIRIRPTKLRRASPPQGEGQLRKAKSNNSILFRHLGFHVLIRIPGAIGGSTRRTQEVELITVLELCFAGLEGENVDHFTGDGAINSWREERERPKQRSAIDAGSSMVIG